MSNRRMTLVALVALSGVVGCGSSGGGTPAGGAATCTAGKLTLVGDLDGQAVNAQVDVTASLFQQLSPPYTLDIGYADGMLEVAWTTGLAYGQTGAATGNLVMPTGSPHAGEGICAGSGAFRYVDSSGGNGGGSAPNNDYFTFDTLTVGTSCPGTTALTGSIDGCVGGGV